MTRQALAPRSPVLDRLEDAAALAERDEFRKRNLVHQADGWERAPLETVEVWALAACQHALYKRDCARLRAAERRAGVGL